MKLVIAYIRRELVPDVTLALQDIDALPGVSFVDVRGFGKGGARIGRPAPTGARTMDLRHRVRLEAICPDHVVDAIVTTIERSAHTGRAGDGKIYVLSVEQAVRISTGERGEEAI